MQVLTRVLAENVQQYGEYPFLYDQERVISNRQAFHEAERIRDLLVDSGVHGGDRVMVTMPNRAEVLSAYQGALMAGAIVVPVMHLLEEPEIRHILADSQPRAVFLDRHTAEKVETAARHVPDAPELFCVDTGVRGLPSLAQALQGTASGHRTARVAENDVAVILYTSGTTGKPKGVMLTHKNLYSNARQVAQDNPSDRSVTLGVLPLAHVYGFTVTTINAMLGGSIVLFPRFEAEKVFQAIERYRVKMFSAVPAMIYAMVYSPARSQYDLSSLEYVSSGSAPCPVALIEAFQSAFHADVLEGYGLSEAAPVVSGHRRGMPVKPGTVGVPVSGVDVRIVGGDGQDLPSGDIGELWIRGDNVTPGYYRNPNATREVLHGGGWLATGDMASIDPDGYLSIVERKKDIIIRGGFNIYPRDVEDILLRHPDVAEAAVVGMASDRMGEEAVAYVVAKPGTRARPEEILEHAARFLARYKLPRHIVVVDTLPKNGVGKIMKKTLREWAGQLAQDED